MIGYTTLGVNDLETSAQFYDSLLAVSGATRVIDTEHFILWSTSADKAGLAITKPFNGERATPGNGVMVAIHADSEEKVNLIYKKALELGASDEGAPGLRAEGFYAGYFRDPEGNKLNAYYVNRDIWG